MTNGYKFDPQNNTLTISDSFAKRASRINSQEYDIIMRYRRDFPNLNIQHEEKRASKAKLNYNKMEMFIESHRNAKELKDEFERIKKLSRVHSMPYKYVKNWFDNKFPYYGEQLTFDEDGFVVDPATLDAMKEMIDEVTTGNIRVAEPLKAAA